MRCAAAVFASLMAAVLAGCQQPAQTTLWVDPAFYPSAVAFDAARDRFIVGSYETGEVIAVTRRGDRTATLRAKHPGEPVLRVAIDAQARRAWVALPGAIESFSLDDGAAPRVVVTVQPQGRRYADIAVADGNTLYAFDAASAEVLRIDPDSGRASVLAVLPRAAQALPVAAQRCSLTGAQRDASLEDGAIALLPDGAALLAAFDGRLWRVGLQQRELSEIALSQALTGASQLLYVGSESGEHRFVALRGQANELATLAVGADGRAAQRLEPLAARFDMPLRGAFDGRHVHVLLGRLRHHPALCGDGRPGLPYRMAQFAPQAQPEHRITGRVSASGS